MLTLFQSTEQKNLTQVKEVMLRQLQQLPNMISAVGQTEKLLRFELTCTPIDVLTWLHNQTNTEKIYWSQREGSFEIGGVGIADRIKGETPSSYTKVFESIENKLSADNLSLRYYGGFSFDGDTSGEWKNFGTYQFTVPRFELVRTGEQTHFACNILMKDIEPEKIKKICNELSGLTFNETTQYRSAPIVQSRKDKPTHEEWKKLFESKPCADVRHAGKKIVLARKSNFAFDKAIKPDALIKHLKAKTPDCYHFSFQTSEFDGFLGASPERLFKLDGMNIESEALAGTIERGLDEIETEQLKVKLLESSKNALEHQFVVDSIDKTFDQICKTYTKDPTPQVLSLKGSQHLLTRFKGTLTNDIKPAQILSTLHPTPALAGSPLDESLEIIKQSEPFSRGWYGGPVGYIGFNQVEFAVAIRCALVQKETLALYAGAGIVDGSDAEEEWEEIENKISRFIKVFNTKPSGS